MHTHSIMKWHGGESQINHTRVKNNTTYKAFAFMFFITRICDAYYTIPWISAHALYHTSSFLRDSVLLNSPACCLRFGRLCFAGSAPSPDHDLLPGQCAPLLHSLENTHRHAGRQAEEDSYISILTIYANMRVQMKTLTEFLKYKTTQKIKINYIVV